MTSARRLLTHERWLADQQARHPTSPLSQQKQNYGTDGARLLMAAVADGLFGGVIVWVGVALYIFTSGPASVAGICIAAIGCGTVMLAVVRAAQASRAGKAYRGGRPFQR